MDRAEHNRLQYLKNRESRLAKQKEYYAKNKDVRIAYNKEYAEKNREAIAAQRKLYREKNADTRKISMKEWYQVNAEYVKAKAKAYREANRQKMTDWSKEYRKTRMSVDPVYRAAIRVRGLINVKIYTNGYTKKSRTHEILGCSYEFFRDHIAAQFREGMSWDNHGEWHLDHIIPIATASTEDDIIRLNHYSNFQPLWAHENLKKGCNV